MDFDLLNTSETLGILLEEFFRMYKEGRMQHGLMLLMLALLEAYVQGGDAYTGEELLKIGETFGIFLPPSIDEMPTSTVPTFRLFGV